MKTNVWKLLLVVAVAGLCGWLLRGGKENQSTTVVVAETASVEKEAVIPTTVAQSSPQALSSTPPVAITSPAQLASVVSAPGAQSAAAPRRIEAPPPAPVNVPAAYQESLQQGPEQQEAEEIALNIRDFAQRFRGNPTGTNAEIVKALTGENEANATYLPSKLRRLNDQGELLDAWGTPYFFHANSATEMEVRSAGPDKKLYTHDDVSTK